MLEEVEEDELSKIIQGLEKNSLLNKQPTKRRFETEMQRLQGRHERTAVVAAAVEKVAAEFESILSLREESPTERTRLRPTKARRKKSGRARGASPTESHGRSPTKRTGSGSSGRRSRQQSPRSLSSKDVL